MRSKRCQYPDCKKIPNFGLIGSSIAVLCAVHKPASGYEDVRSKRCLHPDCKKQPVFGLIGSSIAVLCAIHKLPGYENVKSKRCKYPDCKKQPVFGLIGSSIAEYCSVHKPDGYEDVKSKRCKHSDCKKDPVFGLIGSSIREYCSKHKLPGYEDVKNKRCQHQDCKKQPRYGYLGRTTSYCVRHKESSMILNPIKRCHKCRKIATHLNLKNKLYYCETCDNNALDSIEIGNTCIRCRIASIIDNPDKNIVHCASCIEAIKAGEVTLPIPKNIKEKENRIFKLITDNNYFAIQDSIIKEGCVGSSKRRPDIRLFANWGPLIIEVDENQHRNYTSSCNYSRLNDIYEDIDNEKMVVIRYNPDNYKPFPGYKPASQSERETTLLKHIEEFMSKEATQIPSGINILHLYYDYFNPITQPILLFDPIKYIKHMAENNNDDSNFKLD